MRNRIIFSFIILLTLFLSICAISASENATCDNLTSADEDSDMELLSVGDVEDNADANKSSTEISAEDKVSYVDYEDTFTVKLTSNGTDLANKSVIITLNDEKYNKTTDLNGQVSIKFKLKAGVYNVTYFFDGDENYTSSNGTSTLTVKSDLKTSLNLIDKNTNYCEGILAVFQLKPILHRPIQRALQHSTFHLRRGQTLCSIIFTLMDNTWSHPTARPLSSSPNYPRETDTGSTNGP